MCKKQIKHMNKKYSVFVSSTYEDLKEERQEVVNALLQMDCFPVGMEYFNASDQSQWDVIKSLIDECDYYVLIIAGRYGSVEPKSGKSYTQLEYEYARSIGVPTIAFLYNNPENLPNKDVEKEHVNELNNFKEEVKKHMVKYWNSPTNLSGQVVLSLNQLFKTHKRIGWIRADEKSSAEQNKELLRLREENEKLEEEYFFIDETFNLQGFETVNNVHFSIRNNDGTTSVYFIKGVTPVADSASLVQYLRGLSIFVIDYDGKILAVCAIIKMEA